MVLSKISEEVIKNAEDFEKNLNESFENKKNEILKEFDNQFEEFKSKSIFENNLEIEPKILEIKAKAQIKSNNLILEEKKKLYEDLFSEVLNQICSFEEKDRKNLLSSIIKKVEEFGFDYKKVYSNIQDIKFLEKRLKKNTKIFPIKNFQGLIFEDLESKKKISLSFEEILEEIFNEKQDIIKVLL